MLLLSTTKAQPPTTFGSNAHINAPPFVVCQNLALFSVARYYTPPQKIR
jgi:hypothetical protein